MLGSWNVSSKLVLRIVERECSSSWIYFEAVWDRPKKPNAFDKKPGFGYCSGCSWGSSILTGSSESEASGSDFGSTSAKGSESYLGLSAITSGLAGSAFTSAGGGVSVVVIPNAEKLFGGPVGLAPPMLDLMFNCAKMSGCYFCCTLSPVSTDSSLEVLTLLLGDCCEPLMLSPANKLSLGCCVDTFSPANRFIIKL